jgi:hypothetical protein
MATQAASSGRRPTPEGSPPPAGEASTDPQTPETRIRQLEEQIEQLGKRLETVIRDQELRAASVLERFESKVQELAQASALLQQARPVRPAAGAPASSCACDPLVHGLALQGFLSNPTMIHTGMDESRQVRRLVALSIEAGDLLIASLASRKGRAPTL